MQSILRRHITFSSLAYPNLDLEKVIERVVRFGLENVEIRVSSDGIHIRPNDDPVKIRGVLRRNNVDVILLSSYVRTRDPETDDGAREIESLSKIIDLAENLEVSRIRIFADYIGDINRSINITRKFLGRIRRVVEDRDIRLLFETHDYFAEAKNLSRLLDVLEEYDFTGLLFDPANMMMRGEDIYKIIEVVRRYTYHIHIKDFKRINDGIIYTRPGEGVLPICFLIKEFIGSGRDIYFSIEWEKMWRPEIEDPDIIIPQYIDYMRRCV